MDTWSVITAFGVQTVIIAVLSKINRVQANYERSMEKTSERTEMAIESMRKQIQEGNEKISSINPYFSPNAAIITANQFVEMLQSKKSYCNIMNQLARELKVGCEFKIKDGVIDIEIGRESENEQLGT